MGRLVWFVRLLLLGLLLVVGTYSCLSVFLFVLVGLVCAFCFVELRCFRLVAFCCRIAVLLGLLGY